MEIEKQRELGDGRLLTEARYLAEVNLESLECTAGEKQHYWLLAIRAARQDKILWDREVGGRAVAVSHEGWVFELTTLNLSYDK